MGCYPGLFNHLLSSYSVLGSLPIWFRIASVILAVPFFASSLYLAYGTLAYAGPSAHHYTIGQIIVAAAYLLSPAAYGLFFIWLACGAPRFGHVARPQTEERLLKPLPKLPIWFRITCALLALPLIALTPVWLLIAIGCLTHSGPGGHSSYPYTSGEIVIGWSVLLLPLLYVVFLLWLTLGAPTSLRRSKPKVCDLQEVYSGPRCVACRKPIEPETVICSDCGWTQPK